jgi:hypothetical protein
MKDKQPRRPSKDVALDKLHPRSDMNSRTAGGDKEQNTPLPRRQKSSGPQTTPAKKPSRP